MDVHPYYGPGNVIIDTCGKCHLVWLDFGELKQIGDVPGQDRGRIPASIVADTVATGAQPAAFHPSTRSVTPRSRPDVERHSSWACSRASSPTQGSRDVVPASDPHNDVKQ